MTTQNGESVSDRSNEYDRRIPEWQQIRDCLEGEARIKSRSTTYLPKPTGQKDKQYLLYLQRASFYAVCDRTVRGMVGMVMRIAPMVQLPPSIEAMENFATPEGNPLNTLISDALREVLSLGRYGILVDMPTSMRLPGDIVPYMAAYEAEAIWTWDEVLDPAEGKRKLIRVVVEERPATVANETLTHLRELFLEIEMDEDGQPIGTPVYRQQLWVQVESDIDNTNRGTSTPNSVIENENFERVGAPITPTMNGKPLSFIPFWFINTYNLLPRPDKPPMLDLTAVNLAHFRNSADYEQLLHRVGQPTPWASFNGEEGKTPSAIGSGTFWKLPANATVGLLEVSGQGAQSFVSAMEHKEEHMAALGASLLKQRDQSNVTAEATRLTKGSEVSVLTSAVQNVELALTQACRFAALWAGSSETEVEETVVNLNHDFFDAKLPAAELQALVAAWQSGAYAKETLHENLQRGEIIPPNRTFEEEQELIEAESEEFGPPVAEPTIVVAPDEPIPIDPDEEDEEDAEAEEV